MIDADAQREIQLFFEKHVLPLASELQARGVQLLDVQLNPTDTSYFVSRRRRSMRPEDFERGGLTSVDSAEAEMKDAWRASEGHLLAPLAPGVASLACKLRQQQTQSSELPQFIYAMY